MAELNPQPTFDASTGVSLHQANISGGKLIFPGDDISFQKASWTSPETLVHEQLYHYDVVVDSCSAGSGIRVIVGGSVEYLYGTGHFEGNIPSAASDQNIAIMAIDTWCAAQIDRANITS